MSELRHERFPVIPRKGGCEINIRAIFRSDCYRPVHDRSICPASFFVRGTPPRPLRHLRDNPLR
jgi:hypothetical protein